MPCRLSNIFILYVSHDICFFKTVEPAINNTRKLPDLETFLSGASLPNVLPALLWQIYCIKMIFSGFLISRIYVSKLALCMIYFFFNIFCCFAMQLQNEFSPGPLHINDLSEIMNMINC